MPLPADLRALSVDLPACPRVLLELMPLLRDESAPMTAMSALIETDMALSAAMVRTVNSAMFGLLRRIETVGEALRYLGTNEVAAIAFGIALRASFVPTPRMNAIWLDASQAGLLMGRSARALALDPWQAHTAGLFARSGQAVMLARLGPAYEALLDQFEHDATALSAAEVAAYGVNHGGYGSALCASWGLAPAVVRHVRDRVRPPQAWQGHDHMLRRLLALGAVTDALLHQGEDRPAPGEVAQQITAALADPGDFSAAELLDAVMPHWERLQQASRTGQNGA